MSAEHIERGYVGRHHIDDETKDAARKTVAHYSEDAAECEATLKMLGIMPGQELEDGFPL